MNIPIFSTYIDSSAKKNIGRVLDFTFLSEGNFVKQFEEDLSVKLGLINPVAVNSGTSALHLAVILAGIRAGDEVIMPAQTFIASAMAVLYEKGKPVFADIQYETGNIDPKSVIKKITQKTRAIMVVHWGGYPVDLDEIHEIAREHKLVVIEDAAHALGAIYKSKPVGSISDFTCFSFQAIKHLTTGDGGAVCCLKKEDAKSAFTKRWFGIDRENSKPSQLGERIFDISSVGYKYHMNDYSAALGLANLRNFKTRLSKRKQIAQKYRRDLLKIGGIKLFEDKADREGSCWLFGMHVERRDNFIEAMKSRGISVSVVHQRVDKNSIFGRVKKDLINQARFDESKIHIPIHDALPYKDVDYIINSIKKGW